MAWRHSGTVREWNRSAREEVPQLQMFLEEVQKWGNEVSKERPSDFYIFPVILDFFLSKHLILMKSYNENVFRKFQSVLSFPFSFSFPRSRSLLPLLDPLPRCLPKFTGSCLALPPLQISIFGLFVRVIVKRAFGPFAKTGQNLRRDNQGKRLMLYAEKGPGGKPGEPCRNHFMILCLLYTVHLSIHTL